MIWMFTIGLLVGVALGASLAVAFRRTPPSPPSPPSPDYLRARAYVRRQWESAGRTVPRDHERDLARRYGVDTPG